MRSAARFHEVMTPFRSLLTMASSDDSTTRARWRRATSSIGSDMLWVFDHTAFGGAITSAAGPAERRMRWRVRVAQRATTSGASTGTPLTEYAGIGAG